MESGNTQSHNPRENTVKVKRGNINKQCKRLLRNCMRRDERKGVGLAYMRKPLVRYVVKGVQCYLKGEGFEGLHEYRGVVFKRKTFQALHETLQDIDRSKLELLVNYTLARGEYLQYESPYLKELFSSHMDVLYSIVVDAVFYRLDQTRIEKFFDITVTNCDLLYLKSLKELVDSDLFKGDEDLEQSNDLDLALACKPDGESLEVIS